MESVPGKRDRKSRGKTSTKHHCSSMITDFNHPFSQGRQTALGMLTAYVEFPV